MGRSTISWTGKMVSHPRSNWAAMFEQSSSDKDELIFDDSVIYSLWDDEEWEWEYLSDHS